MKSMISVRLDPEMVQELDQLAVTIRKELHEVSRFAHIRRADLIRACIESGIKDLKKALKKK